MTSGDVTHIVKVFAMIGNYEEELLTILTTLGQYKLVLGIP